MARIDRFRDSSIIATALTPLYLQDPCGVAATALWKVMQMATGASMLLQTEGGKVERLLIHDDRTLHEFWQARPPWDLPLGPYETAVLHDRYWSAFLRGGMDDDPYFRLYHDLEQIGSDRLPDGYTFAPVEPVSQAEAVSDLIRACYPAIRVQSEDVRQWSERSVFFREGWWAVVDASSHEMVALGIAELDARIGEGSLEWIQVLPPFRRRGLATSLVNRLLSSLRGTARFATVSGSLRNTSHPERLYRRCGFTGTDLWHVLRRRAD